LIRPEATQIQQDRSIVRLALSREGLAFVPCTAFFFELKEQMTPEATRLLTGFLNQYIPRLAFVPPDVAQPKEQWNSHE
jgi:hypothetical protein